MREIYVSAANFAPGKAIRSRLFRAVERFELQSCGAFGCLCTAGIVTVSRARVSSSAANSLTRIEPRALGVGIRLSESCASLSLREALPTRTPSPSFPRRSVTVRREAPRECHEVRPFARKRAERSSASPRKLAAQPPAHGLGIARPPRYGLLAVKDIESGSDLEQGGAGCPRRTLRSPGAERSRLPYAAKPRGRGQADVEDTRRRPRAKMPTACEDADRARRCRPRAKN